MTETNAAAQPAKRKLSVVEHIFCAWPIVLVAVGGAIGGACGGAAWAANLRIMRSSMPPLTRYGLCLLTGVGAIALYFVILTAAAMAFPSLFAR